MALSGEISGSLTVRDIARTSMQLIGGPLTNGEVTARTGDLCVTILNGMIKTWQADGCNLWRLSDETVTFPADTKTVTLDPRVLDVMEARYYGGPTYQRSLSRWEWGAYRELPNKDASGTPVCFTLNKQRDYIEMTIWNVPTVDTIILYSGARVIDDVTDLDQEVDVPQEWMECVYYNLADRMLDALDLATMSPATAQRITGRAQALYQKMLDFDRTGSTFMLPWRPKGYGYPIGY